MPEHSISLFLNILFLFFTSINSIVLNPLLFCMEHSLVYAPINFDYHFSYNSHDARIILYLLFLLCFASSFIIGYSTKKKPDTIIASGFAIMIAITVFLSWIRPAAPGIITLDKAEQQCAGRPYFSKEHIMKNRKEQL